MCIPPLLDCRGLVGRGVVGSQLLFTEILREHNLFFGSENILVVDFGSASSPLIWQWGILALGDRAPAMSGILFLCFFDGAPGHLTDHTREITTTSKI